MSSPGRLPRRETPVPRRRCRRRAPPEPRRRTRRATAAAATRSHQHRCSRGIIRCNPLACRASSTTPSTTPPATTASARQCRIPARGFRRRRAGQLRCDGSSGHADCLRARTQHTPARAPTARAHRRRVRGRSAIRPARQCHRRPRLMANRRPGENRWSRTSAVARIPG